MSLQITVVDEAREVTEQTISEFKTQEQHLNDTIDRLTQEQLLGEARQAELRSSDKKENKANIDKLKAVIKITKQDLDLTKNKRLEAERELAKYTTKKTQAFVKQNTSDSVLRTFQDNNIHYVINGRKWWRVEQDSTGGIRIKDHDFYELKDLVFYSTDWEIENEQEVKRFAKTNNRFFKDIVRDFTTRNVSGIYNQMDDIRRFWLQPVYDQQPHPAFFYLTLSIGGGELDYCEQLERLVAYRYVHPEDVMVPNIDSCATGGTGRDTLFNIIRTIFTDECCGEVSAETFNGTHNGDLFGKMWIKVNEQSATSVPIDKVKALTGDRKYRHRQMNTDARDVVRLFCFLFFRNGFTTTAKLAGTGSSGEDRRFEPIIARINLARYVAMHLGLITDLNQMLTDDQEAQAVTEIKRWQRDVFHNREEIAKWLGYIIKKHSVDSLKELTPIHSKFYKEMIVRQRKGIEVFMPKLLACMAAGESTVISVKDAWLLFKVAESSNNSKDWFKNQMMYWLNSRQGWDCAELQDDIYPFAGANNPDRRRFFVVVDLLNPTAKRIFNIEDFIDQYAVDDKGNAVGLKITPHSIRDELK